MLQTSEIALYNGIIQLLVVPPTAFLVRAQARKLLVKNIEDVFSEKGETKEVFAEEKHFKRFVEKSKKTIYNQRERLLILAVLPFALLLDWQTFQGLIAAGNVPIEIWVEQLYFAAFWNTVPLVLFGSIVWTIIGFTRITLKINRQKGKLKISKAIAQLHSLSTAKTEEAGKLAIESVDLSFTELKEALTPFHKIGQGISVTTAIVGLAYSLPAFTLFFLTRDLSPFVYYGFCVSFAVLSFSILFATEYGIRVVWDDLKNETINTLDKLCDKVKFQCVKSICACEDYQARDKYVRDVTFVKSAILDLKELRANNYTLKTASQIAVTAVLPYIPIVLKIAKLY